MKAVAIFAVLLVVLLLGPILLRHEVSSAGTKSDETLVIITPHNEATRYEFARAFEESHFRKTGKRVFVDWRTTGGTAEIARYVTAQYYGSFRDYWTRTLHRTWTPECAQYDDPRVTGSSALQARAAFLQSNAGCGVDLFFGGGSFDYIMAAAAGKLVDSGVVEEHPELFDKTGKIGIPSTLGGEAMWDPKGCWFGTCLGAFGICYNTDSLARMGIAQPPVQWADMADPRYENQLALADPTQSGSVAKVFEMILQQQMALAMSGSSGGGLAAGWMNGMRIIERASANARYFTDGSTDIPYSVMSGDAAAGMCIDFYGRFEGESVAKDGTSRLVYVTPEGGSSYGADSIGLFRGAPHAALAKEFMEFLISPAGQKIWCFKAGAPGGPEKYALRRLAIRPDLYGAEYSADLSDPGISPFGDASGRLVYQVKWTGSLFSVISFVIKSAFIEPQQELKEAWEALIAAHFPPQATALFNNLDAVDFAQASGKLKDALRSPDKLQQVVLDRELDEHFREQYRQVVVLARAGK